MARHQIVITCLTGNNAHDGSITRGSLNLHMRALSAGKYSKNLEIHSQLESPYLKPTDAAMMCASVSSMKVKMPTLWPTLRIYLRGHGGFERQTLGGLGPAGWAEALSGLGIFGVGLYSVTGCRLGRDTGSTVEQPLLDVPNSFASNFHRLLADKRDVYARTELVGVYQDGSKATSITKQPLAYRRKAPGSKVRFTWEDGEQKRSLVYV